MKKLLAILLALAMTMTLVVPVLADEPECEYPYDEICEDAPYDEGQEPTPHPDVDQPEDDGVTVAELVEIQFFINNEPTIPIPAREIGDTTYLRLRYVAVAIGATVTWDGANQTVSLTTADGEVIVIVVAEVGGFNEGGHIWVPFDFAATLVFPDLGMDLREPQPLDTRNDIPYVQPVVRTTNHGELAVEFIYFMNDYLYNRVPFSYQELETAYWIAETLLDMGFDEYAIYIQEFSFDAVRTWMGWFANIADSYNIFDPENRAFADVDATYERELAEMYVFMDETGMTYEEIIEMLADAFNIDPYGMDIFEVLRAAVEVYATTGFIADYGIYDPYTTFRPYSQNVLLTIPGQSEYKIVITAHFDGVLNPGASDNASGVALLLEGAYRMLEADNYFTLVFAFVGAEEVGLLGAYYYHESLTQAQRDNIVLNINADVLFEGPYFFFGTAVQDGFTLRDNQVTQLVYEIAQIVNETYGTALISEQTLAQMPSDQLVFLGEGHAVISMTGLARIGCPTYADFPGRKFNMYLPFTGTILHTPYDCAHFISEHWPSKIADAMWTFGLFLEYLMLMRLA